MSYATGLSCLKDGYINHYIVESPGEVGINSLSGQHYLLFEQLAREWREAVCVLCDVLSNASRQCHCHHTSTIIILLNLIYLDIKKMYI